MTVTSYADQIPKPQCPTNQNGRTSLATRHAAWRRFDAESMLGEALLGQEKHPEAETRLLAGFEGLRKFAERNPHAERSLLRLAAERLIELYDTWGKKEAADNWRKRLAELVDEVPKPEP